MIKTSLVPAFEVRYLPLVVRLVSYCTIDST